MSKTETLVVPLLVHRGEELSVRIELTPARLQGECATIVLRQRRYFFLGTNGADLDWGGTRTAPWGLEPPKLSVGPQLLRGEESNLTGGRACLATAARHPRYN